MLLASLLTWPINILSGYLSDLYGNKKVLFVSIAFSLFFVLILFGLYLKNANSLGYLGTLIIFILTFICSHFIYGSTGAYLVNLFPPRIVATSLSIPYHVGNGIFGGAFFLTNYFYPAKNFNFFPAISYVLLFLTIGAFTFLFIDKSFNKQ